MIVVAFPPFIPGWLSAKPRGCLTIGQPESPGKRLGKLETGIQTDIGNPSLPVKHKLQ